MAGAGVAHLAYRCSFSQEALNWIGNQPENVDLEKVPSEGTKLMWLQSNERVLHLLVGCTLVPTAIQASISHTLRRVANLKM